MSYRVNIPVFSGEETEAEAQSISFNVKVDKFDMGTLIQEFDSALKVFCLLVERLFPEIDIVAIYAEETTSLRNRLNTSGMTESMFYCEKMLNAIVETFDKLHAAMMGQDSRLKRISRGTALALFDKASPSCLMSVANVADIHLARIPFFRSRIYAGRETVQFREKVNESTEDLHVALITLNLAIVALGQVEQRLLSIILPKMAREGPAADYPPIDFAKLIGTVSFWRPSIDRYINAVGTMVSQRFQESIYMRVLLSPLQFPDPNASPVVKVMLQNITHSLPRVAFTDHFVFIDEEVEYGRGINGVVVSGCGYAPSFSSSSSSSSSSQLSSLSSFPSSQMERKSEEEELKKRQAQGCDVTVKITGYSYSEAFIQRSASRQGFGPALISPPFSVHNIENDPGTNKQRYKFTVFVFDRLTMTLAEAIQRRMIGDWDLGEIVSMLVRFEEANFVHHDLKADNIMVKMGLGSTRRWYVIDYGTAWYGGRRYNPESKKASPGSNISIPYGYDFYKRQVILPNTRYEGWSLLKFERRPRRFDLACLIASFVIKRLLPIEIFARFMAKANNYLEDVLFVSDHPTDGTVFYKPYHGADKKSLFSVRTIAEKNLFLVEKKLTFSSIPSDGYFSQEDLSSLNDDA